MKNSVDEMWIRRVFFFYLESGAWVRIGLLWKTCRLSHAVPMDIHRVFLSENAYSVRDAGVIYFSTAPNNTSSDFLLLFIYIYLHAAGTRTAYHA